MVWLVYGHWFILALLLIIAETLGAAGFLLALGMAAAAIGVITFFFMISWKWQLVFFSILSVLFAVGWWLLLKRRTSMYPAPLINRPFEAMLGRKVVLIEAIDNGRGKIKINDAFWTVTGPELPIGSKVKIVAVQDGTLLVVEPVA